MRALQLPAIAAVCPLAVGLAACTIAIGLVAISGCERVVQPIGEYQAETQPTTPPRNSQAGSGVHAQAGSNAGAGARVATDPPPSSGMGAPPVAGTGQITGPPWPPLFDAGADAQTPITSSNQCQPVASMAATRRRLDMYIVMDANITLPYTGLWEFATAGLRAFVTDDRSKGIGVGLRFFGLECDSSVYDTQPDVEVGLLPGNAAAIASKTNMSMTLNASPMSPALQGGIRHQIKRAALHPDWKQVVVLISDGFTQDFSCVYSEQDLEAEAMTGFVGPPSIETYVLGFGFPNTPMVAADILARFSPLDSIADQGGTAHAIQVQLGSDPGTMNEGLQTIRRKAEPCEYLVPSNLDTDQLSLVMPPVGELPRVDGDKECGVLPGWHFDDPTNPKLMVLCLKSCQSIQLDDSQPAQVLYGCPPKRR